MKLSGGGSSSALRLACRLPSLHGETAVDKLPVLLGISTPWRSGSHAGTNGAHAVSTVAVVSTPVLDDISLTGAISGSVFSAGLSSLYKISKAFS